MDLTTLVVAGMSLAAQPASVEPTLRDRVAALEAKVAALEGGGT